METRKWEFLQENNQQSPDESIGKTDKRTDELMRQKLGEMLNKHRNWRERYFPDEVEREVVSIHTKIVHQSGQQFLRNSELMGELIFKSLLNVGNNMIQREAGWLESDGQQHFLKSHENLSKCLANFKLKFNDEIGVELKNLETYENEMQRQLNVRFILSKMEKTFEMIEGILVGHMRHSFRPLSENHG